MGLWVHHFGLPPATRTMMDRFFNRKPKESFRPSRRPTSLRIPTNVALGPLGFQAELGTGPRGKQRRSRRGSEVDRPDSTVMLDENGTGASRVVFRDTGGRSEALPAPGSSTVGTMVGDDKHEDRPIGERLQPLPVVTDAHGGHVVFSHRKRALATLEREGSQQRHRRVRVGTSAATAFF